MIFLRPAMLYAVDWYQAFDKTMNGVHWSLVIMPSLGLATAQFITPYSLNHLPNATQDLDCFVKDTLRKNNCSESLINNLMVKIACKLEGRYIFGCKHIITIPESFKNMRYWSADEKMEISGAICHEAAHIEHIDALRVPLFTLLSPLLSHYIIKAISYPAISLLQQHTPLVIQSMTRFPSAILKLGVMYVLIIFFAKYREYKADKWAAKNIKDPEILRCLSKMLLKNYELGLQHVQEKRVWVRFVYDELLCDNNVHPNGMLRSKIYENSAQELEKSQAN